jgi:aldehyde:ferredoxin oxidoreductase
MGDMGATCGWSNKILRIDLSTGETSTAETMAYAPRFVGGVGIASRIAWQELSPGIAPFDPDNRLFIMTGPLTGTLASGAGRVEILGVAPQQHPSIFSRSGIGGHWGAELKYAGYDGIIVQGRAREPVYLWISDGQVEIHDAGDLWGAGTYATTTALRARHGSGTRVISCGPAGERRSRIAVVQTETGNAAGQGGFGGVMGAKHLKAIAVRGTMGVRVARPREFLDLCARASREGLTPDDRFGRRATARRQDGLIEGTQSTYRLRKCGFCMTHCVHPLVQNARAVDGASVPGVAQQCWDYTGIPKRDHPATQAITSDYGLNGWEIAYGMIPWLQMCKQHGLIQDLDGLDIPDPDKPLAYLSDVAPYSAKFLRALAHKIAFRQGELGDALADGTCYAAERLFGGEGVPLLDRIYPRHCGQTDHWTGHWVCPGIRFPWWLPPVLQWCVDTRDPASDSTHGWAVHVLSHVLAAESGKGALSMEKVRAVCARVYGSPDVCDPAFTYDPPENKVIPAMWHSHRAMVVNSLVLCDWEHTRVFSTLSEDGAADTALMSKLLSACTGHDTGEAALDRAGKRIWNQLRAIDVRYFCRDRAVDESTLDGYAYPTQDDGVILDRARFADLLDKYYELSGWNAKNGWPTRARLAELDLGDVADDLEGEGRLG